MTLSSYLEHSIFPAKNGVPQVTFALYQRKFDFTATALKIGMQNYGPGMIPVSAEALSGYQLNYTELNAVALWWFFFPSSSPTCPVQIVPTAFPGERTLEIGAVFRGGEKC